MTDANHDRQGTLTGWTATAAAVFAAVGAVDWARALWASTDAGVAGPLAAGAVFVALWVLGGILWALVTAAGLWMATGRPTATPLINRGIRTARRWWSRRHDKSDARRLANFVVGTIAAAGFAAASVAWTTYLIEAANLAWLIAVTSLASQLMLAAAIAVVAAGLRRWVHAGLVRLKRVDRCRWLNFPTVALALFAAGAVAAVAVLYVGSDVYFAVEGPALTMLAAAVVAHPAAAYLLEDRLPVSPAVRGALWATPLVALLVVGVASQHSDARRIVVLHGDGANFAFHQINHHVDMDRLFDRDDCPLPDPDGTVDGMDAGEYVERCLDPAYDRPVGRDEVPAYDRPDFDQFPSFVFVTWDSVRVDRLGFMGHDRDTTPNLDAFAADALVFDRAFAQDSGTGPSFWSLMAGKTPFQVALKHGHRFPPPIEDDEPMLGELLEEAGYRNKAIMCGSVFERDYWGIRWGFERFENVCGSELSELAPIVTEESIGAFEELVGGDEPFFLWVHYYDPHHPYNDHPDIGYGDSTLDRYDEELTYTDRHFAELLEAVEAGREASQRPIFTIFGADHGENFGEHGTDPHARNLYRIVTQVPKIVDGPGIEPRRISPPVALNDVYPTVLDLAGVDIPEETTMVSQVPVLYGAEADPARMVFQENSYSRPRRHTRGVVFDRYHYIMDLTTGTDELYDYVDDPLERTNLVGTGLVEERILRQAVVRFLESSEIPEGLED